MNRQHTEISSVGEFGLINRIRQSLDFRPDDVIAHDRLLQGIGDDAAAYRATPGHIQLLTTDALVEGIHFDLTFTSMKHLGWKSIVASLSDIAAMGGTPRFATVTLCLPRKISVEMVEELYTGISSACRKFGCRVAGGDTSSTLGNMVISVALTGEAEESNVIFRRGAKPGDYLCVTGHLGASIAGLKVLQREKQRFLEEGTDGEFTPNLANYARALERYLMPVPRFDLARLLTGSVKVHAMIDISDGLASEVHHLCTAGKVGASVFEHNIPVDAMTQHIAGEFSESPVDYALYGGEEYEILFALDEEQHAALERLTNDVTIIGRIVAEEKGVELVRENGEPEALRSNGWDHFPRP